VAVVPETGHDVPVNEWQIVSERGNIDLFRMVIVKHGAFYDIKDVAYFMPEHAGKIRHLFVIFRWMQDQPGNITFMPLDVKPFGLPYFFVLYRHFMFSFPPTYVRHDIIPLSECAEWAGGKIHVV